MRETTATRESEKWSRGSVQTKDTRSVSSEGIRNEARRLIAAPAMGAKLVTALRSESSTDIGGPRELGAGEDGGQAQHA